MKPKNQSDTEKMWNLLVESKTQPIEETDHGKDEPALLDGEERQEDGSVKDKDGKVVYTPKKKEDVKEEGTKGTEEEREKADVNDDGDLEPWEKKKANKIRKAQGKTHLCAKKVQHEQFGTGECIHGKHGQPIDGIVNWYTVVFEHGTEVVDTEDLTVILAVEHDMSGH